MVSEPVGLAYMMVPAPHRDIADVAITTMTATFPTWPELATDHVVPLRSLTNVVMRLMIWVGSRVAVG